MNPDTLERRYNALIDQRIRILCRAGRCISAAFVAQPKTPFVNNRIDWNV